MKQYTKPITRSAKTVYDEEIEVKKIDKKGDYYKEVLKEPIWISVQNKWHDTGRVFHWTELTFLD